MSVATLQLSNPSTDPDRPSAAVLFANISPLPVMFLVAVDLRRSPDQPAVRVVFRGLHVATPDRMHVIELRAPATRLCTFVMLYAASSTGDPSRVVTAEIDVPGSGCELSVVSIAAYDA
jgi:hypothetical protein